MKISRNTLLQQIWKEFRILLTAHHFLDPHDALLLKTSKLRLLVLKRFRLLQQTLPKAIKEISRVLLSVCLLFLHPFLTFLYLSAFALLSLSSVSPRPIFLPLPYFTLSILLPYLPTHISYTVPSLPFTYLLFFFFPEASNRKMKSCPRG